MPGVARSEAPKRLLTLGRRPQILLEEVQEVKLYNNKGIDSVNPFIVRGPKASLPFSPLYVY